MIKIGANTFDVPAPAGMRSFALQQRIIPIAGSVATVFLRLLGEGQIADLLKPDTDVTKLLPVALPQIGAIFGNMPPGELEYITREMLRDATCDKMRLFLDNGQPGAFDSLMAGRTIDTWRLLWHALQVWYPDFFARAAALKGGSEKPVNHSEVLTT